MGEYFLSCVFIINADLFYGFIRNIDRMKIKNEDIVKKLFEGNLKPQEQEELNKNEFINEVLHQQWEDANLVSIDPRKEEKILKGIMQKVSYKRNDRIRNKIYRYGMVAMVAVCMVLSVLLVMKDSRQEIVYVMNTGHQSIDSVLLADGTKIMLGAGSRLTYPREFSGKDRIVELSGQAFFNVAPDKKHPFIVKTQKMDLTVLGTSFEIFSYNGDQNAEAILLAGKVKVEISDTKTQIGGTYLLSPNEKLAYNEKNGVSLSKVDADSYSSWRNNKRISFKHETLENILPRLEKWYGQKIKCDPRIARYYRFTFSVYNESLDLILNYISHSAPLNYKLISNDHYVIEINNPYELPN